MKINPKELKYPEVYQFMVGSIAPRPVAFVSTVNAKGLVNLSPYSFFNGFSVKPPILAFSPTRRGRDNTNKDTTINVGEVPEVVINVVNYDIVEQMSLSSTEYGPEVNEFEKSGLTAIPSDFVKPPRVKESPVAFECKVREVISFGEEGGAGNMVICEVLMIHVQDEVLDEEGRVDPFKIDLVGRTGGNWYVRANGEALFEVKKPTRYLGVGVDSLPEAVKLSNILTGNDLGKLGGIHEFPTKEEVSLHQQSEEIQSLLNNENVSVDAFHQLAKEQLIFDVKLAMKTLLVSSQQLT